MPENSWRTRIKLLEKCTLGCNEGASSGCTKRESFRTRYVFSNTKTCRIITGSFHFYTTSFILLFLLSKFFKTVGELLHLLTQQPKLDFWVHLRKTSKCRKIELITQNTWQTFSLALYLQRCIFIFTFIWKNYLRMCFE